MNRYKGVNVNSTWNSGAESVASAPRKSNNYAGSMGSYHSRGHAMKPVRPKSNVYLESDDVNSLQYKALILEESLLKRDGAAGRYIQELQTQLERVGAAKDVTEDLVTGLLQNQPQANDEAFQMLLKQARRDRMYNWIKKGSIRPIQGYNNSNNSISDANSTVSSLSQAEVKDNAQKVTAFNEALDNFKIQVAQSAVNRQPIDQNKADELTDPIHEALKEIKSNDTTLLEKVDNTLVQIINTIPQGDDFNSSETLKQQEEQIENLFALIPPVEQSDDGTATVVLSVYNDPEAEKKYNLSINAPLGVFASENRDMVDDDDDAKTVNLNRGSYPSSSLNRTSSFPVGPASIFSSADTDDIASTVIQNNRGTFPVNSLSGGGYPVISPGSVVTSADTEDDRSTVFINNRSTFPVPSRSGGGYPVNSNINQETTQLRSQIGTLETQLNTVKQQQAGTAKNYRESQSQLNNANKKVNDLTNTLNQAQLEYNELIRSRNQLKLTTDDAIEQWKTNNKQIREQAEDRIQALTRDLTEAQTQQGRMNQLANDFQAEIQNQNRQIGQLKFDIDNLNQQIQGLNVRVKSSESERAKLQDDLDLARQALLTTKSDHAREINEALNDLQNKLNTEFKSRSASSLDQLQRQLDEARNQVLKGQNDHQQDRLKYESEVNGLRSQISTLTSQLGTSDLDKRKIDALEEQKKQAGANVSQLQDQINQLKASQDAQIQQMNLKNAGLDRQVGELNNRILDLNREWQAKENQYNQAVRDKERIIADLNSRIKALEAELANLQGVNKKLKEAEIQVTGQLNDVQNRLRDQTANLTQVQNDLFTKTLEDKRHMDDIASLKSEINAKDRAINDLNLRMNSLKPEDAEAKRLNDELAQINTARFDLQLKLNQVTSDNGILRSNFSNLEQRFNQLSNEKRTLESTVFALEQTNRDLQANRSTQQSLQDALNSINGLQDTLRQKDNEISNTKFQVQAITQDLRFKDDQINRLNQDLSNLSLNRTMAVDNTAEISTLRTQLSKAQGDIHNLESENRRLEVSAASLYGGPLELDRLKIQIENLKRDLQTANNYRVASTTSSSSYSYRSYGASGEAGVKQFLAVIASAY